MKVKKIVFIILSLILLQIGRIVFKNLIFIFVDRTLLSDVIVSMIYMILIISLIIVVIKKKKIDINIFPKEFNIKYKIFTILVLLFFIVTPIITMNYDLYNILSLIYNALITVIFEELIFRKCFFTLIPNKILALVLSCLCFGLLHTISYDYSISNLILITLPYCFAGLAFSYCYTKTNNLLYPYLLHAGLNLFSFILLLGGF